MYAEADYKMLVYIHMMETRHKSCVKGCNYAMLYTLPLDKDPLNQCCNE